MKEKPTPNGTMPTEEEMERAVNEKYPKANHIRTSPLIKALKPLLDKMTEKDLSIYQFEKNARQKVQIQQYPDVCTGNRQIFDVHHNLFKTMSQVDALCHYLGHVLLQYFFIVRKDIPLSKFSQKFLEREGIRNFRGQLEKIQEKVKRSHDLYNVGIISEKDMEADFHDYIEAFENEEKRRIAAKFIDDMLESGEMHKSRNRLAVTKHRKYEAKYSKLKAVD